MSVWAGYKYYVSFDFISRKKDMVFVVQDDYCLHVTYGLGVCAFRWINVSDYHSFSFSSAIILSKSSFTEPKVINPLLRKGRNKFPTTN